MLPKLSALAISSPEGIRLPDSDLITKCDNTNVFCDACIEFNTFLTLFILID